MRAPRFFALTLALSPRAAGLSCRNAKGAQADWYFVSKAPGCTDVTLPSCSPLSFVDASTPAYPCLLFPAGASAVSGSALDATLAQAVGARGSTARFLWNDDPPFVYTAGKAPSTTVGATNAHSKGVLVADADGGFWLTHSWPEWPDILSGAPVYGGIANASTIYGQSFLCVSLTVDGVEAVAAALTRAEPLAYDKFMPAALAPLFPRLSVLVSGGRNNTATPTVLAVRSVGGARFTFFSKNGAWGGELWADLVGPTLARGGEMLVETWRRSGLASSCNSSTGNILNVASLFLNVSGQLLTKSYTVDHSKYGITAIPPWSHSINVAVTDAVAITDANIVVNAHAITDADADAIAVVVFVPSINADNRGNKFTHAVAIANVDVTTRCRARGAL